MPGIEFARCLRDAGPQRVFLRDVARIDFAIERGIRRSRQGAFELLAGWPEFAQINRLAGIIAPDRIVLEIDVDAARQRERDHQRRAREEGRAHRRMDARFEIAVAGQHRARDHVVIHDRFLERGIDGAGCADACAAAIARNIEAEPIEGVLQTGRFEILADDGRTGGERSLHPRLHLEAACDGFFCDQTRGEHDARV